MAVVLSLVGIISVMIPAIVGVMTRMKANWLLMPLLVAKSATSVVGGSVPSVSTNTCRHVRETDMQKRKFRAGVFLGFAFFREASPRGCELPPNAIQYILQR